MKEPTKTVHENDILAVVLAISTIILSLFVFT